MMLTRQGTLRPRSMVHALMWTIAMIYLLQIALRFAALQRGNPGLLEALGPDTIGLWAAGSVVPEAIAQGEWWRLLSGQWLHAFLFHVGMNLLVLLQLGRLLESAVGPFRFLNLYLACLVLGGVLSVAWRLIMDDPGTSVGASGAVLGIAGVLIALLRRFPNWRNRGLLRQLVIWVIFIEVLGFLIPNIDNVGHNAGLLVGFVLGHFVRLEGFPTIKRRERALARLRASLAVLLALNLTALGIAGFGAVERYHLVDRGRVLCDRAHAAVLDLARRELQREEPPARLAEAARNKRQLILGLSVPERLEPWQESLAATLEDYPETDEGRELRLRMLRARELELRRELAARTRPEFFPPRGPPWLRDL